jgi:cyanophycinase
MIDTKRLVLPLVLLFSLTEPLGAQPALTPSGARDLGMDLDVLHDAVRLVEKAVADDELRGAVLFVARQGKIYLHAPIGWSNFDKKLPMRRDTLFHVASNTKPVIASAALQLVEEGKIDLEAEVRRYLPSFDTEKSKAITVRQLLMHTSGLKVPTIFLQPFLKDSTLRAEVDRFGPIGSDHPGKEWRYNNAGYNTLGAIIEVVSGQPLEQFLMSRIYQPLGLTDAYHRDSKEMVERRACVYQRQAGVWKTTYQPGDPPAYPFVRASGGLITTAEDYAKFLQMFLNGGSYNGKRVLTPESVQRATAQQTRALYAPEAQKKMQAFYGFGWQVGRDGTYHHGGSDGTFAWADPNDETLGVFFTQSPGPREQALQTELMAIVRRAVVVPSKPRLPATELGGALILAGGGTLAAAVRDRFVELAGGKKARLVVIPTASKTADSPDFGGALNPWKNLDLASATVLHTRKCTEADDPDFVKPLKEATAVWLGNGSPETLVAAYRGTQVEKELHNLLDRGGVIGGEAAGAAALGGARLAEREPRPQLAAGLGILPNAIVVARPMSPSRLRKIDRRQEFQVFIDDHPGWFGLALDTGAAVLVKGRRITNIADGKVILRQAAAPHREPTQMELVKADRTPFVEYTRADLVALSRDALVRAGPRFPPEKPDMPNVPNGSLFIGGGGGFTTDVWKRFVDLAGGPDALILVIPTALEDPLPDITGEVVSLKRAGAKNIKIVHTRSRELADTEEFASVFRQAKGVWFGGGRQWHFVDAYEGTATERAIHDVLKHGGVIGGSSAGASIQSEYMPRGDPLGNLNIIAPGYERGFGFLKGVGVDQHFFARKRQKDMTELVTAYPQILGIGIDEGTALIVHGTVAEVVGKSKAAFYDRRKPVAGDKDYDEVPAGGKYDLEKRKRIDGN